MRVVNITAEESGNLLCLEYGLTCIGWTVCSRKQSKIIVYSEAAVSHQLPSGLPGFEWSHVMPHLCVHVEHP